MTGEQFNEIYGTGTMEVMICRRTIINSMPLVVIATEELDTKLSGEGDDLKVEANYQPDGFPEWAGWYEVQTEGLQRYIVIERRQETSNLWQD